MHMVCSFGQNYMCLNLAVKHTVVLIRKHQTSQGCQNAAVKVKRQLQDDPPSFGSGKIGGSVSSWCASAWGCPCPKVASHLLPWTVRHEWGCIRCVECLRTCPKSLALMHIQPHVTVPADRRQAGVQSDELLGSIRRAQLRAFLSVGSDT